MTGPNSGRPDQPFNNTYWLRNPKFRWEAVIAFDGDRETGIRPEQEAYVSDMKAKFLNTPEVRRHFADPEAAWNAAFTLNDGGRGLPAPPAAPGMRSGDQAASGR